MNTVRTSTKIQKIHASTKKKSHRAEKYVTEKYTLEVVFHSRLDKVKERSVNLRTGQRKSPKHKSKKGKTGKQNEDN